MDNQLISFRQVFHPLTIRAPSLKEGEGLDRSVTFSSLTFSLNTSAFSLTPRRERDGTRRSLRFNSIPLSQGERGRLDKTFTSFQFHSPLSRRERDGTAQSHSVPSPPFGLRPEAVILDRAVFASLSRGQSNPLRGFSSTIISLETKSEALRLRFLFQRRERDSNPRSCDRLRISRPAHSTTLASLRGLHNIV